MPEHRLAIGLMSGTSMDAVDAALVETDGALHARAIAFVSQPYQEEDRALLRAVMAEARAMERPAPSARVAEAASLITERHIAAIETLLAETGTRAGDVDVIGFHGQTIAHRPDRGWTWQIGDGQAMARALGCTVVDDFRSADVAAGGEGAPLAPAYHRALVAGLGERPVAVLNLGGVGNISWFGADPEAWGAFDTGPGNALIDDWVRAEAGLSHDEGGTLAMAGAVHEEALARLLDNPWFDQPPPKSLDRNDFTSQPVRGLSLADGAATLTAFTAESVWLALTHLPERPARLLVTGGGRHNPALMRALGQRLGIDVAPVEAAGWNGDAMEAEAFAYLAVRVLAGQPISYPSTTGVQYPAMGGRVSKA